MDLMATKGAKMHAKENVAVNRSSRDAAFWNR
jgi:hypothetical protein